MDLDTLEALKKLPKDVQLDLGFVIEDDGKEELIIILKNTESQLDLAEDKVEYLTGCPHFGESDGMNGTCVDCSYDCKWLWEKCQPFNNIFWPWHCEQSKARLQHEERKEYKMELF